jgi:hypothetical protein
MEPAPGTIGFIVILTLYASVGVTAAIGAASVTRKVLPPRAEQVFYAVFLAAIAAIYLAFIDYFGATDAWPLEAGAVVAFCVIAALGARVTGVLMFGYLLHGAWDFAHELQAHAGGGVFEASMATSRAFIGRSQFPFSVGETSPAPSSSSHRRIGCAMSNRSSGSLISPSLLRI